MTDEQIIREALGPCHTNRCDCWPCTSHSALDRLANEREEARLATPPPSLHESRGNGENVPVVGNESRQSDPVSSGDAIPNRRPGSPQGRPDDALFAYRLDKTRDALKAEHDGFCAWCLVSIPEPHDPECVSLDVLAEVEQAERTVETWRAMYLAKQERVAEVEAALREIKRTADSRVAGEKIPYGYAKISNIARRALDEDNKYHDSIRDTGGTQR